MVGHGLRPLAFTATPMLLAVVFASCGASVPPASPTTAASVPATMAEPPTVAAGSPSDEGIQLPESGEFERSIEAFTQAIALDPHCTKAYGNRGAPTPGLLPRLSCSPPLRMYELSAIA